MVSGWLHTSAVLAQGTKPPVSVGYEDWWHLALVEEKILHLCQKMNTDSTLILPIDCKCYKDVKIFNEQ